MAALETNRAAAVSAPFGGIFATIRSVTDGFSKWNNRRLTVNALNKLTDRELEDIGLVRGDIDQVAYRTLFK